VTRRPDAPVDRSDPQAHSGSDSNLDAVVLCAGQGRRLRPLTDALPKVMVSVRGRPLLDLHLEALALAGVGRVVLVVGYMEDLVRGFVASHGSYSMEVDYRTQNPPAGTGDGLREAIPSIRTDPFLLVYGDIFVENLTVLYTRLVRDHIPSIVAAEVPDASQYGRIRVKSDPVGPWLEAITEKDGDQTPGLVNAGVYLLPAGIFDLVRTTRPSPRGEFELTDALTAFARSGGRLRVLTTPGWADVGTVDVLNRLNLGVHGSLATDTPE
jgi:UDP-N-acetylglucosamine diphosphorylase / glucose-1-phosphate thymidylyltransferase / UDP-N-acetylgalactosamine diphosphorylase / glucosamine-1-phosphate N-acetyltransferase / galactosamine-1-phosphate N-acetyltransferase